MSYRDSQYYRDAQRELTAKSRCKGELGRFWHHRQFIAALRALIKENVRRQGGGVARSR